MVLQIPITEAVSLIKSKTGKTVNLKVVNSDTVNVGYELRAKVPFFGEITKTVDLDVTIERVSGETVYARYSANGVGMDMVLKGLLTGMPTFSTQRIIETLDGSRLKINLNEIEKAREALKQIAVNSVSFNGSNAVVDFRVK